MVCLYVRIAQLIRSESSFKVMFLTHAGLTVVELYYWWIFVSNIL